MWSWSAGRFDLDELISAVPEVVPTLVWRECIKQFTDRSPEHLLGACARFAQERLELGKELFDRFAMMPLNAFFVLTFSLMA